MKNCIYHSKALQKLYRGHLNGTYRFLIRYREICGLKFWTHRVRTLFCGVMVMKFAFGAEGSRFDPDPELIIFSCLFRLCRLWRLKWLLLPHVWQPVYPDRLRELAGVRFECFCAGSYPVTVDKLQFSAVTSSVYKVLSIIRKIRYARNSIRICSSGGNADSENLLPIVRFVRKAMSLTWEISGLKPVKAGLFQLWRLQWYLVCGTSVGGRNWNGSGHRVIQSFSTWRHGRKRGFYFGEGVRYGPGGKFFFHGCIILLRLA